MDDKTAATGRRRGPNRVPFDTTVHPDTIERIDGLCGYYHVSRGQIVDKLVTALNCQADTVRAGAPARFCLTGERCRFNLADVPPML